MPSVEDRVLRPRRRLERLIGVAATEGNALTALRDGDEIFAAMLGAIRRARHTVDMMTFVYWRGDIAREFAQVLAERARAGVRVRLLLDGFGSRLIETEQLETMEPAGVQVAWFRKPLYLSPAAVSLTAQTEPPLPPQGPRRRRGDGVHWRGGHRPGTVR